ncbi:MAG: phenylalanine--tRNA ligase subunit beta [Verrucomicrobiaceae bacterium]|nr:phenylalanine--tRNA ligase subunit beta [Verrucomicrobiaceae bacterium]
MQVSLNWLSTHIDLSGYTTAQLSDLLTFAGVEVEGIEERGVSSDKVVVAQIKEFVQHPNADRLSVCQVDDGSGSLRQIVCGAKNFQAGDKVPLALPGASLPGGFEINEGKLRGVDSRGMMCSGKELGIGDDHGGLLILDASLVPGTPFSQVMPGDVLFDLEITPNRPDLLSHLGLARELAALTGLPLKGERDYTRSVASVRQAEPDEVTISDTDLCSLYCARVIRGIRVGPSPDWLRQRLESIGMRSINNIVDITNYVLMEMGQPLHAFDLSKLTGGVQVRRAAAGETIKALDEADYSLEAGDLVIADASSALAIAGVMGGLESSVTDTTTDILLEAAHFSPPAIRKTSRRLGLISDSSYRFERGVDAAQTLGAADLAVRLILEVAGGQEDGGARFAGSVHLERREVKLDTQRALRLLGMPDLTPDEMSAVLTKLGLEATDDSTFRIPTYRGDLVRSVDLVEEISRVIGLDRVPECVTAVAVPSDAADRAYDLSMHLRQALAHRGFNEAQTLRLISQAQVADGLTTTDAMPVKSPLSEDHAFLRPSIVPGLISTAAHNIRHSQNRLRFFELGRVFIKLPNGQVREDERMGLLLSGPVSSPSWHGKDPAIADVFDLKGIIESLPGVNGSVTELKRLKDEGNFMLKCEWRAGNRVIGWIGQLHPRRAREIDARNAVFVAELSLSALRQGTSIAKFEELPKFPSVSRDVAMEVAADLPHSKVTSFFAGIKEPLLISTKIFDVFSDPTGTRMPKDRKSLAYSLTYRAPDKTLETADVDAVHQRVLSSLEKALPVVIRR